MPEQEKIDEETGQIVSASIATMRTPSHEKNKQKPRRPNKDDGIAQRKHGYGDRDPKSGKNKGQEETKLSLVATAIAVGLSEAAAVTSTDADKRSGMKSLGPSRKISLGAPALGSGQSPQKSRSLLEESLEASDGPSLDDGGQLPPSPRLLFGPLSAGSDGDSQGNNNANNGVVGPDRPAQQEEAPFPGFVPEPERVQPPNNDDSVLEGKRYINRQCRFLMLFCLVMAIVGGAIFGIVFGVNANRPAPAQSPAPAPTLLESSDSSTNNQTMEPTTASPSIFPSLSPSFLPTTFPTTLSFQRIVDELNLSFGPKTREALMDFSSPQSRAARWMAEEDSFFDIDDVSASKDGDGVSGDSSPSRLRFLERYALAVFYYATGGDVSWFNTYNFLNSTLDVCSWAPGILFCTTECEVRQEVGTLVDDGSFENTITCLALSNIVPFGILMGNNNLTGTLPEEISALSNLIIMSLESNNLYGTIPDGLYNLTNLLYITLSFNQLSGAMSDKLGRFFALRSLLVGYNQLSGSLPSTVSNLTSLEYFDVPDNMLTGAIPTTVGQLSRLSTLLLADNMFTGTIPTELAMLSNVDQFFLRLNLLTGTLPSEIIAANWAEFSVRSNNLNGSLPSDAWQQSLFKDSLVGLELADNDFTGPIPSELGLFTRLTALLLEQNQFTGSIPRELGNLQQISTLFIYSNGLSGTIPPELALPSLGSFSVFDNPQIRGTLPSTFGVDSRPEYMAFENTNMVGNMSNVCNQYQPVHLGADCLEVNCSCCTICFVNGSYVLPERLE